MRPFDPSGVYQQNAFQTHEAEESGPLGPSEPHQRDRGLGRENYQHFYPSSHSTPTSRLDPFQSPISISGQNHLLKPSEFKYSFNEGPGPDKKSYSNIWSESEGWYDGGLSQPSNVDLSASSLRALFPSKNMKGDSLQAGLYGESSDKARNWANSYGSSGHDVAAGMSISHDFTEFKPIQHSRTATYPPSSRNSKGDSKYTRGSWQLLKYSLVLDVLT
jgi:hypothetical protein